MNNQLQGVVVTWAGQGINQPMLVIRVSVSWNNYLRGARPSDLSVEGGKVDVALLPA